VEVTVQVKNSFTRVHNITVPEEGIKEKFEEVLKSYNKSVNIPGFRPGKAPKAMLIQRFGKVIRDEAVEMVVNNSLRDAFEKEKIAPISRAVIQDLKSDEGAPLSYKAEVEVDPEVKLEDYKNLGTQIDSAPVTDADIDKVIDEVRERLATLKSVDRPLKNHDFADMEYKKVVIDGVEKTDYQSPRYPVELGNSQYLKDFEEKLVGLKKGDEKVVSFNFPADYVHKEVASKEASFTVLIKDVKEKELPVLDDEFAKSASGRVETVSELKELIRKDLIEQNEQVALDKAYNAAVDEIIKRNPFDVPESRIANYLAASFENFQKQYPKSEVTVEQFNERNRDTVIRDLKRFRLLDIIGEKEGIKATSEEVDAEIERMAKARHEDFKKVKDALRKSGQALELRERIKDEKTLNFLVGYVKPEKKEESK